MTPRDRLVETHSAWVICIGERAYKVKKPVSLGFLDFSTLESRRRVCTREVALNRRLAPDVYLGVHDVVDAAGSPVEHVVVMRRMPDDRSLAHVVRTGADVTPDLRALARLLAGFHATARTGPDVEAAGSLDSVRHLWETGLDQLATLSGAALDEHVLDHLRLLSGRYLEGRGPLFEQRRRQGFLRDGHGDLLCADIYLLPDGPRVLDCIEFDDALRHGDVLLDIAFLAMDLEDLGRPDLAQQLLSDYDEFSGHPHPASLTDHFVAYRAQVRSKVAFLRSAQGDAEAQEHAVALAELAVRHLEQGAVRLVLVGGLPGTGKSTVAASLADEHGWVLLRSDVLRKQQHGLQPEQPAGSAFDTGVYAPEATQQTYEQMLRRAESALRLGESVVLDATWSSQQWRERAARVAADTSSDLLELLCEAPAEVAAGRLHARAQDGSDASDADPEVARRIRGRFDRWPSAIRLPTDRSLAETLEAVRQTGTGGGAAGSVRRPSRPVAASR